MSDYKMIHGFVACSKKTGRYFKFEEYCDDGYGMYLDSISFAYMDPHTLPTFFATHIVEAFLKGDDRWALLSTFKDHEKEEIEFVPIKISIGEQYEVVKEKST